MKKLLLSLFVGFVGFVSFGYCTNISDLIQKICPSGQSNCSYYTYAEDVGTDWNTVVDFGSNLYAGKTICLRFFDFSSNSHSDIGLGFSNSLDTMPYSPSFYSDTWGDDFVCEVANRYLNVNIKGGFNPQSFKIEMFVLNDLLATALPVSSEQECKTTYSLISPSDVSTEVKFFESEYTSTSYFLGYDNLATINLNGNSYTVSQIDGNYTFNIQLNQGGQCTGSVITGDLQFSNIYINDILHPGKQNIFLNIPDYIMWDYNVVGDDFNIYVGSGYDVDYINSVIDINSYRPTSSDFTNVFVGGLTLIFPYIVIVLFIVFIRKLIKRIFK